MRYTSLKIDSFLGALVALDERPHPFPAPSTTSVSLVARHPVILIICSVHPDGHVPDLLPLLVGEVT